MTISSDAQNQINALISAGLSVDDLAPMQAAVDQLRKYEGLGEPQVFLKCIRRSDLLAEHIQATPTPIQEAWIKVLEERKAL